MAGSASVEMLAIVGRASRAPSFDMAIRVIELLVAGLLALGC